MINYLAVGVAALLAFLIGGLWYSPLLFGTASLTLRGVDPASAPTTMHAAEVAGEFARWLLIVLIVAHLLLRLSINSFASGVQVGFWVWVAIYAALAGSVLHEGYPWRLYAIHAADGLIKLLVISTVLSIWQAHE